MASIDPVLNFANPEVSIGYDASATSIVLSSGEGALLPDPSTDGEFDLVWFNETDYPNPADDPNVEIVRATALATDTLTVTRAQQNTSASTKNDAGTYRMILAFTQRNYDTFGGVMRWTEENTFAEFDLTSGMGNVYRSKVDSNTIDPTTQQDIDTLRQTNIAVNVAAQDALVRGFCFSQDGLFMYTCGLTNDSFYQYNVYNPFDLSTAEYSGNSFSTATQDNAPHGIDISKDGTQIYIMGDQNNAVFVYDLSTAFDVSTASYSGNSFSTATQDVAMRGLRFSFDGLNMYTGGLTAVQSIYEYNLSTAYDITSASYSGNSRNISPQDTAPVGLAINHDGTRLIMTGTGSDNFNQYNLSTPFDLSSSSLDSSVTTGQTDPDDIYFRPDGTELFLLNSSAIRYDFVDPNWQRINR